MNCKCLKIREYVSCSGKNIFRNWLASLDLQTKARIQARLLRAESGNLGDAKSIDKDIYEFRLDFGPGYRVYFGFISRTAILILNGGTKRTQKGDIKQSEKFLKEYFREKKYAKKK